MRVIVTGGAGFIGSALVRYLVLGKSYDVLTIDALTYAGCEPSLRAVAGAANHRFLKADIRDRAAMDAAIATFAPQRIMHLAAESHVDRSITGATDFIQTNVVGTFTLLEAARGYWNTLEPDAKEVFRFLHVSTDEVYGSLGGDGLFEETTPYDRGCVKTLFRGRVFRDFGRLADGPFRGRTRPSAGFSAAGLAR